METYLILLDLQGLDVILGVDWLTLNYALVDCFLNEVIFRRSESTSSGPLWTSMGSEII